MYDCRERRQRRAEFRSRAGRINSGVPAGLILLIVGGVLLAKQLGVIFPPWLVTWEALVIMIGLFVGVRRGFRGFGWIILIGVGTFFLMDDYYPGLRNFVWPAAIILIGLIVILGPTYKKKAMLIADNTGEDTALPPPADEALPRNADVLDAVSIFGATQKTVLSKNFKGGEVVCVFAGSEINLTQADFPNQVKIEMVVIFGGAKLIVPANWEIRSDTTAILGGIDDNREPSTLGKPEKVLILDGTVICGGIEITSY
ncbi:MAG: hypothetical protein WCF67_18860 [Chitinophagaceae bacterium]